MNVRALYLPLFLLGYGLPLMAAAIKMCEVGWSLSVVAVCCVVSVLIVSYPFAMWVEAGFSDKRGGRDGR